MSSEHNRRRRISLEAVLAIAAVLSSHVGTRVSAAEPTPPIPIGARLELLLDD